jgi:hypothetical protein
VPFRIVPIVEGDGEVRAVPVLFRRLIGEFNLGVPIEIAQPIRRSRGSLLMEGGLERAVELAAIESQLTGAVFVLIDSEGECPAKLAPNLLKRAQTARPDKLVAVALAHREFEAWFLASASSLKGQRSLSQNIEDHPAPEDIQNCKGWLEDWMPPTSKYAPPVDQPALAARFDLGLARRSRSFRKLCKEFEAICKRARSALEES